MNERPPAGWYKDPYRQHAFRYWDHQFWTAWISDGGATSRDARTPNLAVARPPRWPRRSAGVRWRVCLGALSALGVFVLVWGYVRYANGIEARLHGGDYYDYYCRNDPNGRRLMSTIEPLWLPWLTLIALAGIAWWIWYRVGRGDWVALTLAIFGTTVVVITFPIVGWFAGGLDCGL